MDATDQENHLVNYIAMILVRVVIFVNGSYPFFYPMLSLFFFLQKVLLMYSHFHYTNNYYQNIQIKSQIKLQLYTLKHILAHAAP